MPECDRELARTLSYDRFSTQSYQFYRLGSQHSHSWSALTWVSWGLMSRRKFVRLSLIAPRKVFPTVNTASLKRYIFPKGSIPSPPMRELRFSRARPMAVLRSQYEGNEAESNSYFRSHLRTTQEYTGLFFRANAQSFLSTNQSSVPFFVEFYVHADFKRK